MGKRTVSAEIRSGRHSPWKEAAENEEKIFVECGAAVRRKQESALRKTAALPHFRMFALWNVGFGLHSEEDSECRNAP